MDASADEVTVQLFKAFSCGLPIPESIKQLRRIVRDMKSEKRVLEPMIQSSEEDDYGKRIKSCG